MRVLSNQTHINMHTIALKDTQVLVQSNYWATEKIFWEKERTRAKQELHSQGYTVLRHLVPTAQVDAFAAYNRKLWQTMGGMRYSFYLLHNRGEGAEEGREGSESEREREDENEREGRGGQR